MHVIELLFFSVYNFMPGRNTANTLTRLRDHFTVTAFVRDAKSYLFFFFFFSVYYLLLFLALQVHFTMAHDLRMDCRLAVGSGCMRYSLRIS